MKLREIIKEQAQYYDVKHKPSGKVYRRILAMSQASAITRAAMQHGGRSASKYSGTSDDQFEIVEGLYDAGEQVETPKGNIYTWAEADRDYSMYGKFTYEGGEFTMYYDPQMGQFDNREPIEGDPKAQQVIDSLPDEYFANDEKETVISGIIDMILESNTVGEAIGEKDQYELSIRDKKNPSQTVTFQKGLTLNQANDKVYKLVKGIRQWGNDPSKLNFDNEKMDPSRIILIKNGKQIPHDFQPGGMGVTEDSGNPLLIHGLKAYKYTQGGKDYYISVQNGKETGQFDSLQDLKIHQTSLINGEIDSYVDNRNMGHPDGVSTMEGTLTEEQFDEAAGEKDACYHKVKSRYDVWPSAYASGALVKCRKVGAKNWGNSKK